MRAFKLLAISLVFFFLLLTGLSLLIPSHIHLSKAVIISARKEKVFHEFSEPINWKHWYPGGDTLAPFMEDGIQKGLAKGDDALLIQAVTDSSVSVTTLKPSARKAANVWSIYGSDGSVTARWQMDFHLNWYPWEKFGSLMFEKQYGIQMEMSLDKLKKYCETEK